MQYHLFLACSDYGTEVMVIQYFRHDACMQCTCSWLFSSMRLCVSDSLDCSVCRWSRTIDSSLMIWAAAPVSSSTLLLSASTSSSLSCLPSPSLCLAASVIFLSHSYCACTSRASSSCTRFNIFFFSTSELLKVSRSFAFSE